MIFLCLNTGKRQSCRFPNKKFSLKYKINLSTMFTKKYFFFFTKRSLS